MALTAHSHLAKPAYSVPVTLGALGTIIIVLVAAAGLTVWLVGVFHAERHPESGRDRMPARKVTGGTFRGDPRQQVPSRNASAEQLTPDRGTGERDHRS